MPGRSPRWKRGERFSEERCGVCGGRELVPAVDNDGRSYRGCARCTLALPPEVLAKLEEQGRLPRDLLVALKEPGRSQ